MHMTEETHPCAKCPGGGPRCEYHYCGKPATCHVWQPRWRTKDRPAAAKGNIKFMCDDCYMIYHHAMTTPMKGIDRPPGDQDWKGSLLDHIRHAQIAIAFEERLERERLARLSGVPVGQRDPRWLAIVDRMCGKQT